MLNVRKIVKIPVVKNVPKGGQRLIKFQCHIMVVGFKNFEDDNLIGEFFFKHPVAMESGFVCGWSFKIITLHKSKSSALFLNVKA